MSNKIFSKEEIEILSNNTYVKHVSEKGITYTDEFKKLFISENEKGKFPREIFEECGFDIGILGMERVKSAGARWRSAYRKQGILWLKDTRKENSGRPREEVDEYITYYNNYRYQWGLNKMTPVQYRDHLLKTA